MLCALRFDEDGMLRLSGAEAAAASDAAAASNSTAAAAPPLAAAAPPPPPSSAGAPPMCARFWAAGLSFSRAALLAAAPYCPHLPHLFFGEELYQLARMWTRGYDVFSPAGAVAFHQWERSGRVHSYQGDKRLVQAARRASQRRVLCMLGVNADTGPEPLEFPTTSGGSGGSGGGGGGGGAAAAEWAVGGVWGLGVERSLEEFERHCGVRFADRVVL